jgi:hypothetical protein
MLIVSPDFHCSQEILTIVAMLSGRVSSLRIIADRIDHNPSVPNVWRRPNNHRRAADVAKRLLTVPDGDHLTLLDVFDEYQNSTFFCLPFLAIIDGALLLQTYAIVTGHGTIIFRRAPFLRQTAFARNYYGSWNAWRSTS